MWGVLVGALLLAEGFGAGATGGRGGSVIKVTTLDATGPGSLQEALDTAGPRIVVFDVSGVIEADVITIPHGDLTIAGESAPGAGITIAGQLQAAYQFGTDNIILRHIRVRLTDFAGSGEQGDALQMSRCANVLLDHVSVSFGIDETVDLYEAQNVTVQWSTIESAATMGHPEGMHNYGLINGPDGGRISVHHNLFAHNQNRNPALATGPAEVRNNVVYNVRHAFVHHNPAAGPFSIVGNYFKAGGDDDLFPFFFDDENGGAAADLAYFLEANYIEDPGVFEGNVDDPWQKMVHPSFEFLGLDETYRADTDFDFGHTVTTTPPLDAYDEVLACAGAFPRDAVTLRSVQDTMDGTGMWGANAPADLLEGLMPGTPEPDGDGDGMPDAWEEANDLDPADGTDHGTDVGGGLTAIEAYLQERADELVGSDCAGSDGGSDTGDDGGSSEAEAGDGEASDGEAGGESQGGSADSTSTSGASTGAGTGASEADGGDDGCGCRHVGGSSGVLLLFLGLLRRRR